MGANETPERTADILLAVEEIKAGFRQKHGEGAIYSVDRYTGLVELAAALGVGAECLEE